MPSEDERSGTTVDGRYRLRARLGQGGMGAVYDAEHIELGQRCAIKFMHPDTARKPEAVRRFLQEARVLSKLRHEHVVRVLDLGRHEGTAYYVMDFLEGEDLKALLRREGPLPWARVRAIALQICDALSAIHAQGIVHRDLKPANCVCVAHPTAGDFTKLIDFGVAKVARPPGEAELTATGEAVGTVEYMAPEQFKGQGDTRSDIYALGLVVFELLSGRLPFSGYDAIAHKLTDADPPRLRHFCPTADPAIEQLLARAMSREPERRQPSMAEFAAEIAAIPPDAPPQAHVAPVLPSDPTIDVAATTEVARVPNAPADTPPQTTPDTPPTAPADAPADAPSGSGVGLEPAPELPTASIHTSRPRRALVPALATLAVGAIAVTLFLPFGGDKKPATPVAENPPADPAKQSESGSQDQRGESHESGTSAPPKPDLPQHDPKIEHDRGDEPPPPPPPPAEPKRKKLLTDTALKSQLDRRLQDCRPTVVSATLTILVTPTASGELKSLELDNDDDLPPVEKVCVAETLAKYKRGFKERLAADRPFPLTIHLPKKSQ